MGRAHEVRAASMAKTAAMKSAKYAKWGKEIFQAAKAGVPDPEMNQGLKNTIARAKKDQCPADVIKRAIEKAQGVKSGATKEKVYEGYGPGQVAVIVECLTDNDNRTFTEVRTAFNKTGGTIGTAVSYMFSRKAVFAFEGLSEDEAMEALMAGDADFEDLSTDEDGFVNITADPSQFDAIKAALEAAKGYFEAAGYTFKDGKISAAPSGAKTSYEVMIGGGGSGDHPSFGILTAASEALKTIGFDLVINDLADTSILWSALEAGTAELWCAAWQTTLDPDMFQIYHSEGGSAGHYRIYSDELDELVSEARTVTDQAVRKALYKEALDFVVDFACEIPVYQRQDCNIFSTERINVDTITPDQTTYYTYLNEIHKIAMN
jgi:peptide/nickel transport system substrate-binding protein